MTFLIAVIVLATAAVVFVLQTPDARLWIEQFPLEVTATIGASLGVIVVLLTIALAGTRRARRGRDDWATAREGEARTLAAALRGEMIALSQWLEAQADTRSRHGGSLRSNVAAEDLALPNVAARIVYEANATRLSLLGPDLAGAIAYCHASFERAESEQTAPEHGNPDSDIALLRAIHVRFEMTTRYLDTFVAGKPVVISAADRDALFAPM